MVEQNDFHSFEEKSNLKLFKPIFLLENIIIKKKLFKCTIQHCNIMRKWRLLGNKIIWRRMKFYIIRMKWMKFIRMKFNIRRRMKFVKCPICRKDVKNSKSLKNEI
jgi:hypothetical protein